MRLGRVTCPAPLASRGHKIRNGNSKNCPLGPAFRVVDLNNRTSNRAKLRPAKNMTRDKDYVVRRPRHLATAPDSARAWIEYADGEANATAEVQLVDFSRQGLQFLCPVALSQESEIVVCIAVEENHFDLRLPGNVRWQRPLSGGRWGVGCVFKQEVDWSELGELFLHDVLAHDLDS